MDNVLLKALAYDKQVRIYVVRCDEALNGIGDRLKYHHDLDQQMDFDCRKHC